LSVFLAFCFWDFSVCKHFLTWSSDLRYKWTIFRLRKKNIYSSTWCVFPLNSHTGYWHVTTCWQVVRYTVSTEHIWCFSIFCDAQFIAYLRNDSNHVPIHLLIKEEQECYYKGFALWIMNFLLEGRLSDGVSMCIDKVCSSADERVNKSVQRFPDMVPPDLFTLLPSCSIELILLGFSYSPLCTCSFSPTGIPSHSDILALVNLSPTEKYCLYSEEHYPPHYLLFILIISDIVTCSLCSNNRKKCV
jgi:hypothetical protein